MGYINEEIVKSNILIAEFMGLWYRTEKDYEGWHPFDKDWNWLMPVIGKIYNDSDYNWKYFDYNGSLAKEGTLKITTSINDTYQEVINFIKYKNELR